MGGRWPLLLLMIACKPDEDPVSSLTEGFEMGPERCCDVPVQGIARLEEAGLARGLEFELPEPEEVIGFGIPGVGGAITASDLDADGDLDLVLGGLDTWLDFYVNDGTGHFNRYTYTFENNEQGQQVAYATGAADLNGDLLPELVLAMPGRIRILENLGGLTWSDWATLRPDYGDESYTYQTVVFGDLDSDGDLDFFLPSMEPEGQDPTTPSDEGGPDTVFLQVTEGQFAQAADLWVTDTGSRVQAATITDRDLDGDLDLMSLSDLGPPSAFWRNDGLEDGVLQWTNDAAEIGADLEIAAMGVDSADLNRDGLLDYCISDVGPPRCLLTDGQGGYFDGAFARGVTISDPIADYVDTIGWSVELADLDNSGWPELIQASGPDPGAWEAQLRDIPNVIWWADDEGAWTEQSDAAGFNASGNHIGMVTGDFNQDGFLEVVVAGPGQRPLYYENSCGEEAWLEVELIGPPENTEAIGARVQIWSGVHTEVREIMSVRDKAQTASRVHLGLGSAEVIDRVTITWPDGHVMESEGVLPRRLLTVRHPDAPDVDFSPFTGEYPEPIVLKPGQVLIYGMAMDSSDDSGLPGVLVEDLDGSTATTDVNGQFQLAVHEDADVDLRLTPTDDFVPVLLTLQSGWQTQLQQGLTARMTSVTDYGLLHEGVLGEGRDRSLGSVWVSGQSDQTVSLSLTSEFGAAVVIGDSIAIGDELDPEDHVVIFLHVPPGEVTLQASVPDGSCQGREIIPVEAGLISTVYLDCSQP